MSLSLRSTLVHKKIKKKDNKNSSEKNLRSTKEIMKFTCLSDAVQFSSDAMRFSVGWRTLADLGVAKKKSVRTFVILKLLLNRKELEGVFYMKKLCLDDIFSTAYNLNHFDQRFAKISQKTAAASRSQPYDFQN